VSAASDRSDAPPNPATLGGPSPRDRAAFDRLFVAIERRLRVLAHELLQQNRRVDDLDTTVLVHDMYLKLSASADAEWTSQEALLAAASKIFRSLLTDAARARDTRKRGGCAVANDLETIVEHYEGRGPDGAAATDLLDLDAALAALEAQDAEVAKMVELNYYLGMSGEEIANVFGVSVRTVFGKLERARTFLKAYMDRPDSPPAGGASSDVPI